MTKRKSPSITAELAAVIKRALLSGKLHQHQIAARLGINQGRISEIKTGKKWVTIPACQSLPHDFG